MDATASVADVVFAGSKTWVARNLLSTSGSAVLPADTENKRPPPLKDDPLQCFTSATRV